MCAPRAARVHVIYCERLSERGEDNPDLRRLDGGVDELVQLAVLLHKHNLISTLYSIELDLVQLAVLHREVVALSDGGLRTGGGVRRRRAQREDAGTVQPT